MAKELRIVLPEALDARLDREAAFLEMTTSPIPPDLVVSGVRLEAFEPRDPGDSRVRETTCTECLGHKYLRQDRGSTAALVPCPVCRGTGRIRGLVSAVITAPIDGVMEEAAEFIRLFGGDDSPVRVYPHLLLRRSAPIEGRNGETRVWVDPDGRMFPTIEHPRLGRVLRGEMAVGVSFERHGDYGDGLVEFVGALRGNVLREVIAPITFSLAPTPGISIEEFAGADVPDKLEVWGVDLPAALSAAFNLAFWS